MVVTQGELVKAARSFDSYEMKVMRDGYALAFAAFRVTHRTDADLEAKMASIVLFIYASDKVSCPTRHVDVRALAEESLDTLIRFTNAAARPSACAG